MRARVKITPREKSCMSPFLAWGDFRARSHFARSTIPEEKWGTTRILPQYFGTPPAKLLLSAIATLPQPPLPPDPPPLLPDHQILLQWQKVLVTEKWNTKVNNALL